MIDTLTLKNFAAFKDLHINFTSGINVIIGENGCGKTQLLKAAYASNQIVAQDHIEGQKEVSIFDQFVKTFGTDLTKIGDLAHKGTKEESSLNAQFADGTGLNFNFNFRHRKLNGELNGISSQTNDATFIPTKEVLSFIHGLTAEGTNKDSIKNLFDKTYLDLFEKVIAHAPEEKEERIAWLLSEISNGIGGIFEYKNNKFSFRRGKYEAYKPTTGKEAYNEYFQDIADDIHCMAMTAEGFKKLGVLQLLLAGHFVGTGSNGPLIWDEPEANLNPQLMECLVKALLAISLTGQQIIIATHDYVLLKWLDLLADEKKGHHLRFHTLYRNEEGRVSIHSCESYKGIEQNSIAETYDDLTKAQVQIKMKGLFE